MVEGLVFEVLTPLGFSVRCTKDYWSFITEQKHPIMAGRLDQVVAALKDPDQIRRSSKDSSVLLFYRADERRWTVAVSKDQAGGGFLVTCYPSDSIKIGELIWKKSE